jgi:hypothetical protein
VSSTVRDFCDAGDWPMGTAVGSWRIPLGLVHGGPYWSLWAANKLTAVL